ncbi:MAG: right-handed parallel beta-helix repeat-containing protein [Elusimicrobia bacterium]|nr:right-handed parallel beta-helix repeat-containing protein [Elusimicrobiota bacterium]
MNASKFFPFLSFLLILNGCAFSGKYILLQAGRPVERNIPSAPSGNFPRTIVVDQSGKGDFLDLSQAQQNANPGDIIRVRPGLYPRLNVVKSRIKFVGEDRGKTILQGVSLQGIKDSLVEDFTILASTDSKALLRGWNKYAVYGLVVLDSEGVGISKCIVRGAEIGILVDSSKDVSIQRCLVQNNKSGVWIEMSKVNFSDSVVYKNLGGIGWSTISYGLGLEEESTIELKNNTIISNGDCGAFVTSCDRCQIRFFNNLLSGHERGIWLDNYSTPRYSIVHNDFYANVKDNTLKTNIDPTNIFLDPLFVNPAEGDFRLRAESPLATRGLGGTYIGAFPPVGTEPGSGDFK